MYIYTLLYVYLIAKVYGKRKKMIIDIFIILVLTLGFSYCMGVDWIMYQYYYDIVLDKITFLEIFDLRTRIEKLFLILNYLGKRIGMNYEIFKVILEGIFLIKFLKFLQKKTDNIAIAVIFLLSAFLFGSLVEPGIRQFIASVLGIYSVDYFEKRNFFKSFLLIFLGGFLHKSLYIFLIIIIFYQIIIKQIDLTLKKVIIILIILFFIINNMNDIVLSFSFFEQYQVYFLKNDILEFTSERVRSVEVMLFYIGQVLLYLYITIFIYPTCRKYNKSIQYMAILGILFLFLENKLPILFRFRIYFLPYLAIVIGNIDSSKKIKICFKEIIKIIVILISILYFINMLKHYKYKYIPYRNYIIECLIGKEYSNYYEKVENFNKRLE